MNEAIVILAVKDVAPTAYVEFCGGCLFVDCITETQAALIDKVVSLFGKTEVTRIGNTSEYAYDFVA